MQLSATRQRLEHPLITLWHKNWIVISLAVLKLLTHLLTNTQYGFFRDELAYLDDTKHLAWGFVDHPPLAPFFGALTGAVFGQNSLFGLRFFPALLSAALLILVVLIVHEMGGGRLAQIVAALAFLGAPVFVQSGILFQSLPFEQFLWVLCVFLLLRLINTQNPRWCVPIGLVIGLSALTKYTIVFYVISLGIALLLTPQRKYLYSRWFLAATAITLAVILPNIMWQASHQFISLTYTTAIHSRDITIGRADGFVIEQLLNSGFVNTLLVSLGLYFLLWGRPQYRALGIASLIAFGLFLIFRGRYYYLSPAYPPLFAAGACQLERWWNGANHKQAITLQRIILLLLGLSALSMLPLLPIFPVASSAWATLANVNESLPEMVGWDDLAAQTALVFEHLPQAERQKTGILALNYGEAGALNLYGDKYHLPRPISPVNSYFYWSTEQLSSSPYTNYVVLGSTDGSSSVLQEICGDVEWLASVDNRYHIENEESQYGIYLCRDAHGLEKGWSTLQGFG